LPDDNESKDDLHAIEPAEHGMDQSDRAIVPTLDEDLRLICEAARKGGAIGLPYAHKDVQSWLKSGNSPVTEADMAIDSFLHDQLTAARPDYGWISEESRPKPVTPTRGHHRTFVIDPIDGTRGFMEGSDEWTVCIAILDDGIPVAGVVYNPARDELYHAALGSGARCNDTALAVSRKTSLSGARLAASKKAVRTLGVGSGGVKARYVPSLAYRLAGVASGVYDGTISTGRAHIWDIAAAAVIVTEAGGFVTDTKAAAPVYTEQDCRVPPLVVAGPDLHSLLCAALRTASAEAQ
jgi:myo-inositol-1(or 4)-monophosphatase